MKKLKHETREILKNTLILCAIGVPLSLGIIQLTAPSAPLFWKILTVLFVIFFCARFAKILYNS